MFAHFFFHLPSCQLARPFPCCHVFFWFLSTSHSFISGFLVITLAWSPFLLPSPYHPLILSVLLSLVMTRVSLFIETISYYILFFYNLYNVVVLLILLKNTLTTLANYYVFSFWGQALTIFFSFIYIEIIILYKITQVCVSALPQELYARWKLRVICKYNEIVGCQIFKRKVVLFFIDIKKKSKDDKIDELFQNTNSFNFMLLWLFVFSSKYIF